MNISEQGLAFLYTFEGSSNVLYNDDGKPIGDPTSRGHCTIGIGRLVHENPCDGRASEAPYAGGISDAEVIALLRQDVASRVRGVNRYVLRPISQEAFDACVDFTFNCGIGAFAKIAPVVNAGGDFCKAIAPWGLFPVYARQALTRRRNRECELYTTGNYGIVRPLPGGAGSGDDDMWRRHNETAMSPYWNGAGRHGFAPGEIATLQLGVDLPGVMAKKPRAIDLDVYTDRGALVISDGSGAYAGRLNDAHRERVIRVVPKDGTIQLEAGPNGCDVSLFGVVGYVE